VETTTTKSAEFEAEMVDYHETKEMLYAQIKNAKCKTKKDFATAKEWNAYKVVHQCKGCQVFGMLYYKHMINPKLHAKPKAKIFCLNELIAREELKKLRLPSMDDMTIGEVSTTNGDVQFDDAITGIINLVRND